MRNRTDIHAMLTLAKRASMRGNSMFLSIPHSLKLGAPYRGVGEIPDFLKTRIDPRDYIPSACERNSGEWG